MPAVFSTTRGGIVRDVQKYNKIRGSLIRGARKYRFPKAFPSRWPREVPPTYKSIREVASGSRLRAGGPGSKRRAETSSPVRVIRGGDWKMQKRKDDTHGKYTTADHQRRKRRRGEISGREGMQWEVRAVTLGEASDQGEAYELRPT